MILMWKLSVVIGQIRLMINSKDINIKVKSSFLENKSNKEQSMYLFLYSVKIQNDSRKQIKLITRHWDIEDANGDIQEVNGEGIIGEQPILKPGESFTYNSYCPLQTYFGTMKGFYTFLTKDGEVIKTMIPEFGLVIPDKIN